MRAALAADPKTASRTVAGVSELPNGCGVAVRPVELPADCTADALTGTLREVMESVESDVILQGLIRTHWNKSQLAKELGISRSYLIQKCTYYGLERKD